LTFFERAAITERQQERKFYKYFDLEAKKRLHFSAPDLARYSLLNFKRKMAMTLGNMHMSLHRG
jgi:1-deoxy-D-xylulose 5-phosphate reductoisomerase